MTNNEILNTRNLPKTNRQIQKASPKKIAVTIASAFMYGDIKSMGRNFDNLFENGRTEQIKDEFTKIYNSNEQLRKDCKNSRFFSPAMLNTGTEIY